MGTWVIKSPEDYARAMKAIQDKLDDMVTNVEKNTNQAVADVALDCLGRSVERAPVETGDLRGSGYASVNGSTIARGKEDGSISASGAPPANSGDKIDAEIGFTSSYAFVQHEHTEFNHPMGGQAKYLESVIVENAGKWQKHLMEAAKDGLRGDET